MRKYGGLINRLPFTYICMLIGSLSLLATPYLTGFYSKDLILEVAYGQYNSQGSIGYWLGTITACITAFYSFRLINLTFISKPNGGKKNNIKAHEPSTGMTIPLVILGVFSIGHGYIASDQFIGLGSGIWGNSIFIRPDHLSTIEGEFGIPLERKILPLLGSIMSIIIGAYIYKAGFANLGRLQRMVGKGVGGYKVIYRFFNGRWLVDNIYNSILLKVLEKGNIISKKIDKGVLEIMGVTGLVRMVKKKGYELAQIDNGYIPHLAINIIMGFMCLGVVGVGYMLGENVVLSILILGVLGEMGSGRNILKGRPRDKEGGVRRGIMIYILTVQLDCGGDSLWGIILRSLMEGGMEQSKNLVIGVITGASIGAVLWGYIEERIAQGVIEETIGVYREWKEEEGEFNLQKGREQDLRKNIQWSILLIRTVDLTMNEWRVGGATYFRRAEALIEALPEKEKLLMDPTEQLIIVDSRGAETAAAAEAAAEAAAAEAAAEGAEGAAEGAAEAAGLLESTVPFMWILMTIWRLRGLLKIVKKTDPKVWENLRELKSSIICILIGVVIYVLNMLLEGPILAEGEGYEIFWLERMFKEGINGLKGVLGSEWGGLGGIMGIIKELWIGRGEIAEGWHAFGSNELSKLGFVLEGVWEGVWSSGVSGIGWLGGGVSKLGSYVLEGVWDGVWSSGVSGIGWLGGGVSKLGSYVEGGAFIGAVGGAIGVCIGIWGASKYKGVDWGGDSDYRRLVQNRENLEEWRGKRAVQEELTERTEGVYNRIRELEDSGRQIRDDLIMRRANGETPPTPPVIWEKYMPRGIPAPGSNRNQFLQPGLGLSRLEGNSVIENGLRGESGIERINGERPPIGIAWGRLRPRGLADVWERNLLLQPGAAWRGQRERLEGSSVIENGLVEGLTENQLEINGLPIGPIVFTISHVWKNRELLKIIKDTWGTRSLELVKNLIWRIKGLKREDNLRKWGWGSVERVGRDSRRREDQRRTGQGQYYSTKPNTREEKKPEYKAEKRNPSSKTPPLQAFLKDLKIGYKRAEEVMALPPKVEYIYNNIYTRVIRFIGGSSVIVWIMHKTGDLTIPDKIVPIVLIWCLIHFIIFSITNTIRSYVTIKRMRSLPLRGGD